MAPLTVFLLSLGFCAYTIFGYPLLLGLLARVRNRPIRKAPKQATVSVILPVRDGAPWIAGKLQSLAALQYPAALIEILVISDGSTDATREIVLSFPSPARLELIELPRGGKAAALNAGIARATGEILFFTDVRQDLAPDSLANLVACFSDPSVGVASGELVIRQGKGLEEASVGLYWRYEKWIRKHLTRVDSVLGATGCIYAMRRELAAPLPEGTLVDDMYLPLTAFFRGYRVIMDESARAFDYPTKLNSEFRRKVRTLAGVYQIISRYPSLMGSGNRMWIHFVSHKLARLFLPWAMLAAFVSSLYLQPPFNAWAIGAQSAAYGLALADPLLTDHWWLKRVTAPARAFLVLMAASFCALSILFIPAHLLWGETRVSTASGHK